MSTLGDVGLLLAVPGANSATTYVSFTNLAASTTVTGEIDSTSNNGSFSLTIVNPSGSTAYLQSGAIITISYDPTSNSAWINAPPTISWSGCTLQLTYEGYSGAVSVTFPNNQLTTPLSATLQEQNENTNSVTIVLSYNTPSNMTNLADIGMTLATEGSPPVYYSFGNLSQQTYTNTSTTASVQSLTGIIADSNWGSYASTPFLVVITNPSSTATTYVQSGAIITIIYADGSTINWSGMTFSLSYQGCTGSVSLTLP